MADLAVPRWKEYCKEYDIDFEVFKLPQKGSRVDFCWDKIELCQKELKKHVDYLIWVDIDILLINKEISPSEFVVFSDNPITMCSDSNGLCTGFFVIKNNTWGKKYIDTMLFLRSPILEVEKTMLSINAGDQSCAKYMMGFQDVMNNVSVIPDNDFITYPGKQPTKNTFAIHYWANGNSENKKRAYELMKKDSEKYKI